MLTEKMNAIFPLYHSIFFQPFPVFSSNVHITTELNGTIMITFSMHSVVSFCSPFTVSQRPQPPMTLDNGFIHKLRFNSARRFGVLCDDEGKNGLKYITYMPGLQQQLQVAHIELSTQTKKELDERFVLIYTGQRRLARNLLPYMRFP